jgi:uncharacterized protein YndB with AHSA1/START domain
MSRFEAEATIARAAQDVWLYAADVLRHPEWMSVADAQLLKGQGTEVGARGRECIHFGPLKWDVEFEVVEAVPGRRILWRADDRRFGLYEVGLDLEQTGTTSTRARYQGAIEMRGFWRFLAPLIAMEGPAAVRRELERLKAKVEAAEPRPAKVQAA